MTDVIAGRFALCDPIARGGSGVVWRAYDRKLQRFCAAKVLRRRDAGDLLRFVREQSVRIAHPHVLTPYSWAAEDTHVVIASELADGGSVGTLIGDYGALDEPTAALLLDQLLEALEHVHAAGVIHRDVKPANLLLRATGTSRPHLMLSDFGIAMGAGDAHLTEAGTVVGTPGYLAPELMGGGVHPDPRQDLYAAGRVAIAMLAGEQPREIVPLPVEAAPGALRDLVAALTAARPEHRPGSASVARSGLRPALVTDRPRTRDGDPVEVLHQLAPLTPEALHEAVRSAAPTAPLTGARVAQPAEAATAPVADQPPSTAVLAPRSRRRPGRRVLIGAGFAAAAIAVGVPVAIAVTGSDGNTPGGGPTTTIRSGTASPSAGSTGPSTAPTATAASVRLGENCTWQQEGNRAQTADRQAAVCSKRGNGYVWTAA